jgi:hypothetical protein
MRRSADGARSAARALAVVAAVALVLSACGSSSSNDDGVHPVTTLAPTLPASVAPGSGILMLAAEQHSFSVTCDTNLTTTTAVNVVVDFRLVGHGDDGSTLSVLRQETQGATVTTTDTVTYINGATALEAQRVGFAGSYVDLREADVSGPLLDIKDGTVTAEGVFGPPGSTADSSLLQPGQLIATCPS